MLLHEMRDICLGEGIKLSRFRGQNFLHDKNILQKILAAGNLKKTDIILEVGPGLGVLTEVLAPAVKKVVAVEIDKQLVSFLSTKFGDKFATSKKVVIVENDILEFLSDAKKWQAFCAKHGLDNGRYKIIANLPYNITSIFFRNILEAKVLPEKIIVMIQKEVADRIIAVKGERSLLSLSVAAYSTPKKLFEVSANSFWPKPKVDSAVISLENLSEGILRRESARVQEIFWQIAKAGFASRRKKLIGNLSRSLPDLVSREKLASIFHDLGFDDNIRAEELTVENWIGLARMIVFEK